MKNLPYETAVLVLLLFHHVILLQHVAFLSTSSADQGLQPTSLHASLPSWRAMHSALTCDRACVLYDLKYLTEYQQCTSSMYHRLYMYWKHHIVAMNDERQDPRSILIGGCVLIFLLLFQPEGSARTVRAFLFSISNMFTYCIRNRYSSCRYSRPKA